MNERWVCKHCFADNEATSSACHRCGLSRGAESTEADPTGAGTTSDQPAWRRWLRFWWIPVLAVVLAIGYLSSARRSDDGSLESAGTVTIDDLRAGDCFNSGEESEISDVDGVPCTENHQYQVFAVGSHEAETYPESQQEMVAVFTSVCEAGFASFVGIPWASSELGGSMITPSEESWSGGDRTFVCFLYDPRDAALTVSMEGARR